MHLSQSPGQLLERDVRLGPDELQQEHLVRGQFACGPWRSALRLGREITTLPLSRCQSHGRAGRYSYTRAAARQE